MNRIVLSLLLSLFAACSTTLNGESCSYSGECGGGLICVNMRCTTGTAGYSPTGKVCVAAQCRNNMDCPNPQTCAGGKCVCMNDTECPGGKCSGGKCVQCAADTDCMVGGGTRVCVSGVCREPCVDNFDCADFFACQGGKCAFVGCTKDKECAVAVRDVRAKCDTGIKTCFVPCTGDTECSANGNLTGGWFGLVCAKGRCENVGCDNDAECQVFLPTGTSGTCQVPPTMPTP